MNTLGTKYRLTLFGESHGRCVGVVIDGCPAGLKFDEVSIQKELDKRRPGQSEIVTQRKEEDKFEILSGVFNNYTTGAPIALIIWNKTQESGVYELRKNIPRPGHSDYTAHIRFGGFNDYRGGGMFSGRLTACYVMAGAVAKMILKKYGIDIVAHTTKIGTVDSVDFPKTIDEIRKQSDNKVRCADAKAAEKMIEQIMEARSKMDSIGGVVECIAENVPPGIGEPRMDTVEGEIARAMFAIPAVKEVLFGDVQSKGSENNDAFIIKNGKIMTGTNNSGGALGGITTGAPIKFRVRVKPASSIALEQKSVDVEKMKPTSLKVIGKHDPCIVPRAVPVVESVAACVILDLMLRAGVIPNVLKENRRA
ncbi:chorismate synthase [Candidatus Micrarchaeota archaeon]|nr:chorismate synthase [Candidatus Micrarchaeota archaeon]